MKRFLASLSRTAGQKIFRREALEFAFAEMRNTTDWNVQGPLLWGYFFVASSEPPLSAASAALGKMRYRTVSIRRDDDEKRWWLHAERVEVHSIDSLHARNQELVEFAGEMKVRYDGWDVGPVREDATAKPTDAADREDHDGKTVGGGPACH
jgi:hypothetical protein